MYVPMTIPTDTLATLQHNAIEIHLKASCDAQDWFEANGKSLLEDVDATLHALAEASEHAMIAALDRRVTEFLDSLPVSDTTEDALQLTPTELATELASRVVEFPLYVYVTCWVNAIVGIIQNISIAEQMHAHATQPSIITPEQLRKQGSNQTNSPAFFRNQGGKKGTQN